MAGRSDRAEGVVAVPAVERVYRFEPATRGKECRFPRRRRSARIGVEAAAAVRAEALEMIEVRRRMDAFELGSACAPRLQAPARFGRRAGVESFEHSLD